MTPHEEVAVEVLGSVMHYGEAASADARAVVEWVQRHGLTPAPAR